MSVIRVLTHSILILNSDHIIFLPCGNVDIPLRDSALMLCWLKIEGTSKSTRVLGALRATLVERFKTREIDLLVQTNISTMFRIYFLMYEISSSIISPSFSSFSLVSLL